MAESPLKPIERAKQAFKGLFDKSADGVLAFDVQTDAVPGGQSQHEDVKGNPVLQKDGYIVDKAGNFVLNAKGDKQSVVATDDKPIYFDQAELGYWNANDNWDEKFAPDTLAATLELRTNRTVVLGDSHALTCVNGSTSSCKFVLDLNLADKSEARAIFSMTGVAHEVKLKVDQVETKKVGTEPSHTHMLALPSVQSASLAYGSISYIDKDKIQSVAFLKGSPTSKSFFGTALDLKNEANGEYANLSLVRNQPITYGEEQSFGLTSTRTIVDSGNVPVKLGFNSIQFPTLPEDTGGGKILFSGGQTAGKGVNIYDYSRGFGRLSYNEVDTIDELLVCSMTENIVNLATLARAILVCTPVFNECFMAVNTTHSYSRGVNASQNLFPINIHNDWSILKVTIDPVPLKIKIAPAALLKITRHYGGYCKFDYPGMQIKAGPVNEVNTTISPAVTQASTGITVTSIKMDKKLNSVGSASAEIQTLGSSIKNKVVEVVTGWCTRL